MLSKLAAVVYGSVLWLGCLSTGSLLERPLEVSRRQSRDSDSTGILDVFQVYQPVPFAENGDNTCNRQILLMEHVFANSYGQPFIGKGSRLRFGLLGVSRCSKLTRAFARFKGITSPLIVTLTRCESI